MVSNAQHIDAIFHIRPSAGNSQASGAGLNWG